MDRFVLPDPICLTFVRQPPSATGCISDLAKSPQQVHPVPLYHDPFSLFDGLAGIDYLEVSGLERVVAHGSTPPLTVRGLRKRSTHKGVDVALSTLYGPLPPPLLYHE